MFKKDMTDTSTTNIVSGYISKTYPKKDTIKVEPVSQQINCETTGKILGYRDVVKIDLSVWTNYMCNKLGCLSQGWKAHSGTDTIKFICHKDKPKYIRATYVRYVCDIRPKKQRPIEQDSIQEGI